MSSFRLAAVVLLTLAFASAALAPMSRRAGTPGFASSMNTICVATEKKADAVGVLNSLDDFAKKGSLLLAADQWD